MPSRAETSVELANTMAANWIDSLRLAKATTDLNRKRLFGLGALGFGPSSAIRAHQLHQDMASRLLGL